MAAQLKLDPREQARLQRLSEATGMTLVRLAEVIVETRELPVPPGLTGLAQIHGRYHTDAEYKLGYDLQYLVNWSPVLDLEIIARTIWVILARRV